MVIVLALVGCTLVGDADIDAKVGTGGGGGDSAVDSASNDTGNDAGGDSNIDTAADSGVDTASDTNHPPSLPTIQITPAEPFDDEDLSCVIVAPSVDPDSDAVDYVYVWSVDGGAAAGVTSSTVDRTLTTPAQTWTCSVAGSDGVLTSDFARVSVSIVAVPTCGTGDVTLLASGVEFVTFCAQTFVMGCTAGSEPCNSWEYAHEVELTHDYYMGKTEVTQRQFETVMGYNPTSTLSCGDDCPVESVTWYQAADFANAVSTIAGLTSCYACDGSGPAVICEAAVNPYNCDGFRIPTEAEWEAAARCGTDFTWAGSNVVDDVAWYAGNSGLNIQPVARKDPNSCGVFDMSGNVAEWAGDGYYSYSGPVRDPLGGVGSEYRVFRGGSYGEAAEDLRVTVRTFMYPTQSGNSVGFRLARTAP